MDFEIRREGYLEKFGTIKEGDSMAGRHLDSCSPDVVSCFLSSILFRLCSSVLLLSVSRLLRLGALRSVYGSGMLPARGDVTVEQVDAGGQFLPASNVYSTSDTAYGSSGVQSASIEPAGTPWDYRVGVVVVP